MPVVRTAKTNTPSNAASRDATARQNDRSALGPFGAARRLVPLFGLFLAVCAIAIRSSSEQYPHDKGCAIRFLPPNMNALTSICPPSTSPRRRSPYGLC